MRGVETNERLTTAKTSSKNRHEELLRFACIRHDMAKHAYSLKPTYHILNANPNNEASFNGEGVPHAATDTTGLYLNGVAVFSMAAAISTQSNRHPSIKNNNLPST